jgi:signal transduction histidine kinase
MEFLDRQAPPSLIDATQGAHTRRPRPIGDVLSLRVLLILGFASVFLLWLFSAFVLVQRMADADEQSSEIRARFLRNDQLLSLITTRTLQSSVSFRDAVLNASGPRPALEREMLAIRDEVERALDDYEPREASRTEEDHWLRLETEIHAYWDSVMLGLPRLGTGSREALNDQIIPKRQAIFDILEQIHSVNEDAFLQEQAELGEVRGGLRAQVWRTSATAGILGIGIAFLSTRYAGRLEGRIREQHALDIEQKQELERLSTRLILAQEHERRRIARELHDEIGQALGAIKLELAVAERKLETPAGHELAEARAITDQALQSVRGLAQLLHPSMLDDLGLLDTASTYLQHFTRRTGVPTDLSVQDFSGRLSPEVEECAYRVIQEAVTNVGRHASASTCHVRIERQGETLRISVDDNGRGFDLAQDRPARERGLGLISVRERVIGLGGTLAIESEPGHGTRLVADLPLIVRTA